MTTPYNVGSVLRRLFSTVWEQHQYCGGIASVLQRNSISTAEAVQYCGGIATVHVGGLRRDSYSTCGGIAEG